MMQSFTCIVCPNGCDMAVETAEETIVSVQGALCPRGEAYVEQELRDPRRTIASSVLVDGGEMPLVSVRVSVPVPKNRIFDVMQVIRSLRVAAPVCAGEVLVSEVLGLACNIVATRHVRENPKKDTSQKTLIATK